MPPALGALRRVQGWRAASSPCEDAAEREREARPQIHSGNGQMWLEPAPCAGGPRPRTAPSGLAWPGSRLDIHSGDGNVDESESKDRRESNKESERERERERALTDTENDIPHTQLARRYSSVRSRSLYFISNCGHSPTHQFAYHHTATIQISQTILNHKVLLWIFKTISLN